MSTDWKEYTDCFWGEMIRGTKVQLQRLGLGVGLQFPGEPGGPKQKLTVHDPRGFRTTIEVDCLDGGYTARVHFPHVPEGPAPQKLPAPPGLTKRERTWGDEYRGTAEALAAAGLVQPDQLPGQPGMRKVCVTILPDGSVKGGPPQQDPQLRRQPGARTVQRVSGSTYLVTVQVGDAVVKQRRDDDRRSNAAWRYLCERLPRPRRLVPMEQSRWARFEAASARAARDTAFQGMLGRIVSEAGRPVA